MSDEKNSGYFDLSKALDEVRHESFGAKETAVAGLKLFGKGMFNVARFAVKEVIPAAVEQTAKHNARTSKDLLKRDDLSDEQRNRLEQVRDKSQQYLDAQEQKRHEQEAALNADRLSEGADVEIQRPTASKSDSVPRQSDGQVPASPSEPSPSQAQEIGAASLLRQQEHSVSTCETVSSAARISNQPPELVNYLQLLEGVHERVHVGPQIPPNKLDNARNGRPVYCRNSTALLLVDDTVRGSGKDGLLVTEEHISFKAAFSDSHDYAVKFVRALTVPDSFKFGVIPPAVSDAVLSQLRAFIADRLQWHESQAERGARDSQFFLSMQYEAADERGPYWLIRAAQAGHPTAQYNLGMHLKELDRGLAIHWFELAAVQGHELARMRLTDLRRASGRVAEAQIPQGATRLIDLMSAHAVRELEQKIDASHAAMRRAMQRIADEERQEDKS